MEGPIAGHWCVCCYSNCQKLTPWGPNVLIQGWGLQPDTMQIDWRFARQHQNREIRHWGPVLFTDQSRFTLSTWRHWRTLCCLQHPPAWPVWWWVSPDVREAFLWVDVQPFICSLRYQDETLRPIVRPHTGAVGSGILLMPDNVSQCGWSVSTVPAWWGCCYYVC